MSNSTNFSNNTINTDMPLDIIVYGTLFYTLIFIMGVTGNSLVIYVLMKEKEMRNFTNYLLANLSVADLMVLFTCVPSALHDLFAKERWYLGKMMCHLIAFIENCMGNASLFSIFLITIERYYAICRPLKIKSVMPPSRTLKLVSLIWFICITMNLPFIYWTEYKTRYFYDTNMYEFSCTTVSSTIISFSYFISVTFLIYVIIGIVLLVMYYQIAKCLKNSTILLATSTNRHYLSEPKINITASNEGLKKSSTTDSDTKTSLLIVKNFNLRSSNSSVSFKNNHQDKLINFNKTLDSYIKPRQQLIYMLMCVIIVFYVCLFPLKIWNLAFMMFSHKDNFTKIITLRYYWYITITCRIFFYTNSFINPILYNCLSKKFRNGFMKLPIFRICCHYDDVKKNLNSELETRNSYIH